MSNIFSSNAHFYQSSYYMRRDDLEQLLARSKDFRYTGEKTIEVEKVKEREKLKKIEHLVFKFLSRSNFRVTISTIIR